jgi:hypothetical protein
MWGAGGGAANRVAKGVKTLHQFNKQQQRC